MDNAPLYEKSMNGPVLYIRHGNTAYNTICQSIPKTQAKVMEEFIDCPLSEQGHKQSQSIGDSLKDCSIKYAFCSPLKRTLETADTCFLSHPSVDKLKIIVHPLLIETVSGVHDFCVNVENKKEMYNDKSLVKFDWSYFDQMFPDKEEQELYYLKFIDMLDFSDDNVMNLLAQLRENSGNLSQETKYLAKLSSFAVSKNLNRLESLKSMLDRATKFKTFLKEFLIENNEDGSNNKVIVFCHSAFTKLSTSKLALTLDTIPDFPEDCLKLGNCEAITMII